MDFTLGEEQVLLRDTAARLLTAECPPSLVRDHVEVRTVAKSLWHHLAQWVELGEGPLVDLCLFLEETGAVCAPGPFFATTALYAPLAAAVGAPGAGDGMTGTVAMAGAAGEWVANGEPVKTFVIDADLVDSVAFVVAGPRGPAIGVTAAADLSLRDVEALDRSRRFFEVAVPDELDTAPIDAAALDGMLQRAWIALAAEMLGTARWLFNRALDYAKQREQFGRPIGSFQALQHKLANMALARERAEAAVYYAAMAYDSNDADKEKAAHVAKAQACEAAHLCAKDAIQIHGGIGFTWEHDLHFWMRRAFTSEYLLGTADWHHDRLGNLLMPSGR